MAEKSTGELVYLKKELGFQLGEWQQLDAATQLWYREAAREEMKTLGMIK